MNWNRKYLVGSLLRGPQRPERRREYPLMERLQGYQRQVLLRRPLYLARHHLH